LADLFALLLATDMVGVAKMVARTDVNDSLQAEKWCRFHSSDRSDMA